MRLLEHHGDAIAPESRISFFDMREHVAPVEADVAADDAARLATSRSAENMVTLLPEPDSPTRPSTSPLRHGEVDPVDGLHHPVGR